MKRSLLMLGLVALVGAGLLIVLSALLSARPTPSLAAPMLQSTTEAEPNNDFDHANDLTMPGTVYGEARNQPITDTDFFSVPTTAGLSYKATLNIGGAGDLLLKILVYDFNEAYLTSSSSTASSAEVTWTAYGPFFYIEVQPTGPTTSTLFTATYVLDAFQIAATPTPTPQPTATSPGPTPTPTPAPPTPIPGADRFEPNYDFDHAATIGVGITYDNLNFIPWNGGTEDNDYYKIWVKPGLLYTCETLNLGPGVDTNLIVYDGSRNPIGGNDDVELGDYRSRFSYFSNYEGYLYILIGHGGRLPITEVENSTYSLRCTMEVPGQPTATPSPRPTSTPYAGQTPTPPTSPLATPTPSDELTVRLLTTPTPPPPPSTPSLHFVPVDLLVYYDADGDRAPDPGEGVAGITVLAYDTATGKETTQGFTDESGRLRFTVAVQGRVRISIPYLGVSQIVGEEGATLYIRIAPSPLP